MILPQLAKYFSIRVVFTIFLAFQISACSNKELAQTITDNTSTESTENTGNSDIPTGTDIILSWSAPSEREDNEPISLSEIAGYKIYFGTAQRNYPKSINVNDATSNGYTIKNISTGTYYFALTTYDTAGLESQYSTEIKIVV